MPKKELEKTSQVHPSVSHSAFRMFVSNPNLPFFGGDDGSYHEIFSSNKKHTHKHTKFTRKNSPNTFPKPNGFPGFPNISFDFPLGRFGVAKVQSTPRILRLRTRYWATLPSCSPGEFQGDYGNYKGKGCEKQTVNIENNTSLHVYVYIYKYFY